MTGLKVEQVNVHVQGVNTESLNGSSNEDEEENEEVSNEE